MLSGEREGGTDRWTDMIWLTCECCNEGLQVTSIEQSERDERRGEERREEERQKESKNDGGIESR